MMQQFHSYVYTAKRESSDSNSDCAPRFTVMLVAKRWKQSNVHQWMKKQNLI